MGKKVTLKSKGLDKIRLRQLYEEHTDREIAEMFEVTDVAISRARKRWGIETKSHQARQVSQKGVRDILELTPVELRALYQTMTDAQIGKMFGVSKTPIRDRRLAWGIESISKSERYTSDETFTDIQKQVLWGTLLGDGCLLKRGVFKVSHAYHQLTYLRRKHALLSPHAKPIYYGEKVDSTTGQTSFVFGFKTVMHVWLKEMRALFYPEGKRIFPSEVLRDLSPLSLAFWYGDDGTPHGDVPSFALGDVSEAEGERVCEDLHFRFGIEFYLKPYSRETTCKVMTIRARHADMFFHLVERHLTPDLTHKIPAKFRSHEMLPRLGSNTPVQYKLPRRMQTRCKAWASLKEEDKTVLLDDLVTFWHEKGFPSYTPRPEEISVLLEVEPAQVIRKGEPPGLKPFHVGQSTCQAFAEHIWDARNHAARHTPREVFEDSSLFKRALRTYLNARETPVTGTEVRAAVRVWNGVYNFRPAVAKVLLDRYCPPGGVVFDPCAGYGGRLLGALTSKSRPFYVGCEVHPQGVPSLRELVRWVSRFAPEVEGRVELHNTPAEDFDIGRQIDVMITSPPYWMCEVYSEGPRQSRVRFPEYGAWLEGFLSEMLRRVVRNLKPGGWVLLNVDDFKIENVSYPLREDSVRICEALGLSLVDTYRYELAGFGTDNPGEALYAFVLPGEAKRVVPIHVKPVSLLRCQECGRISTAESLEEGICTGCLKEEEKKKCEECRREFNPRNSLARFCSGACGERNRRRRNKVANPPTGLRTFTCTECGKSWQTEAPGRFRYCPACKEERARGAREKMCQYRECGRVFVDDSRRNSASYCCVEHRRREKLFRSGQATDVSYFRKPDPVLEVGVVPPRVRTYNNDEGEMPEEEFPNEAVLFAKTIGPAFGFHGFPRFVNYME